MNYGVHNNLALMNANRQMKINTGNRAKSSEKLSTGYRLNRSADDAAGLAISEKMRQQILGLNRGTLNGQEGISWVQTGDGALEEVHALLQRMRELTIQSLNDTNTPADRAACQMEFDALQSEVDRISKTTQFNTQNVFDEHELPYYQCEGNVNWSQAKVHVVSANTNDLKIKYRDAMTDAAKEVSFTVPVGEYTTQELIDEMEDAIHAAGLDEEGIVFEFTERGTCNLNLEGGEIIDEVSGGLSYLLYEMYTGGGFGALVGTTTFLSEYAVLDIVTGQNDNMTFDIESFGGGTQKVSLTIPQGSYTRSQLINMLNGQLTGTDVTATEYGSGIKLAGKNSIVTGFKGNMFKIDPESNNNDVYHSVFYDNVSWGTVNMNAAVFRGGYVKPTSDLSLEYAKFEIKADNNELIFTANGSTTPVTITIPPDNYTVDQMVVKLDDLFAQAGLELDASDEVDSSGYKRIVITSQVKGATSQVGIDANSSAYETLFVKRTYNKQVEEPLSDRERRDDCLAKVTGAKQFISGGTDATLPLKITAGNNDSFTLTLKDANGNPANYNITLASGDYATIGDIVNQINSQLQSENIDNLVKAQITSENTIELIALTGSGLTGVEVKEYSGNSGYNDLFVKTTMNYISIDKQGTGTPKTIILDKVLTDPMTFPDGDNTLKVKVNGQEKTVTFPPNQQMTQAEILQKINQELQAAPPVTAQNTFSRVEGKGTAPSKHFDKSGNGQTTVKDRSYSNTGSSSVSQGTVGGYDNNKPATITLDACTIPAVVDTTNGNNYLEININGVEHKITLEEGLLSRNDFVNKLQSAIDKKVADYYGADYVKGTNGQCFGGATVSLNSNNQLVITSRLNYPNGDIGGGKYTSLACNTNDSSLLKKLHTTETAASVTSSIPLQDSITITDDNNTFSFWMGDGDTPYDKVTVTLDSGNYNRSTFIAELNSKLSAHDVTATLNNNGTFALATDDVGNDTGIKYDSNDAGTSVEAIFGEMVTKKPATGTANCDIQEEIVINADGSNGAFHVLVSDNTGTYQSVDVTLQPGTYDRSGFVQMLNDKLAGSGLKVELDSTGKRLTYTTDAVGTNAKFVVDYSSGGSSMLAIYGERQVEQPGVVASVDPATGKLILTGNGGVTSLVMTPTPNNTFLPSVPNPKTEYPDATAGYASNMKAYINGASLTEPVKITALNNVFKFTYVDGETAGILNKKDVNITLAEKDYTFSELKDALEAAIIAQAGADKVTVTVDANGVYLEAKEPGSKHYFEVNESQAGGFYHRIMHRIEEKTDTLSAGENRNNLQKMEPAYTVGRQDVANRTTVIRTGINDTLTLDFTYGTGNTIPFTVVIPPGEYSGSSLVTVLQEKLNEQMEAAGYDPGMIEVGIGGVDSNVDGAHDDVALVFKLSNSDKVKLPGNGTYIIDGVRGNAAFSIFYQTEGEMQPAYITGSKDVSKGVTIKQGETELSFKVDDTTTYTLTLTEGDYTAEELIDEINAKMPSNAPVIAELYNNNVRLMYTTLGEHKVSDVNGSAKNEIFFQENGEIGTRENIKIQLSSSSGNSMEIDRPLLNTCYLGINSVAITKPKYANKALARLDEAIAKVSEARSNWGSEQNRLEHAIANNENTSENTQASESRLRDTDMAAEMVKNAKYNILQQVTESMMAQGKVSAEGVLRLLQM